MWFSDVNNGLEELQQTSELIMLFMGVDLKTQNKY